MAHILISTDLVAGTRTITHTANHPDGPSETVEPIDPDELEGMQAADREEKQLARLDTQLDALGTGLADLKAMNALTFSDYSPGAERDMARQVIELRQNQLTLIRAMRTMIRLTRNMAAEDDGQ